MIEKKNSSEVNTDTPSPSLDILFCFCLAERNVIYFSKLLSECIVRIENRK